MLYDLKRLETYLKRIIVDYMEYGVIKSDVSMDISDIIAPDIYAFSALTSTVTDQKKHLSTIYSDKISNELLEENITKINETFKDSEKHNNFIESLLKSYRLTCFLIAKQIYEK